MIASRDSIIIRRTAKIKITTIVDLIKGELEITPTTSTSINIRINAGLATATIARTATLNHANGHANGHANAHANGHTHHIKNVTNINHFIDEDLSKSTKKHTSFTFTSASYSGSKHESMSRSNSENNVTTMEVITNSWTTTEDQRSDGRSNTSSLVE